MKHIARYGKVWKHKKTGRTFEREIELKPDEKIEDYEMVIASKKDKAEQPETKTESNERRDGVRYGKN